MKPGDTITAACGTEVRLLPSMQIQYAPWSDSPSETVHAYCWEEAEFYIRERFPAVVFDRDENPPFSYLCLRSTEDVTYPRFGKFGEVLIEFWEDESQVIHAGLDEKLTAGVVFWLCEAIPRPRQHSGQPEPIFAAYKPHTGGADKLA